MTADERKARPVYSGVLKYFPKALLEIAHVSKVGNDQHNPGESLRWAKEKSTDEADALVRHLLEAGTFDDDGIRHSAKVAWRALALLERELEACGESGDNLRTSGSEWDVGERYDPCQKVATKLKAPKCRPNR